MRVALINPNTNAETTAVMTDIALAAAPTGWTIEGLTAPFGPPLIAEPMALARAADAVLALAPTLAGFDAAIVAAFGDPGRAALARLWKRPVVGIAEAGMAEAASLSGGRFSVVTTTSGLKDAIRDVAIDYGWGPALASIRTTSGDAAGLMADPARLEAALADLIRKAIAEDGARAVVIGGGPLAKAARALARRFSVPVIAPIPAAVRALEARL